jgi:glycerophosphoryl diester phosphodiesterase
VSSNPHDVWFENPIPKDYEAGGHVGADGSFDRGVVIIAHRGNGPTSFLSGGTGGDVPPELAPENTLKSFKKAFAEDADAIELDVYVSADGIPMVIHDDELNVNVAGADRKGRELGLVSGHTFEQLQSFNVGQGEKIPSLRETIELIARENRTRAAFRKKAIMINIEIKGKRSAVRAVAEVQAAIHQRLISEHDIVFCSFQVDELREIRQLDPRLRIAPQTKTALLFGQKNVDAKRGWYVSPRFEILPSGIETLQRVHDELHVDGFDAVVWDLDYKMIHLAKDNHVALYAATSNFRNYEDTAFVDFLLKASENVPIYFKSDEPAAARRLFMHRSQELAKIDKVRLARFVTTEHMTFEEAQKKIRTPDTDFHRLIRPGTKAFIEEENNRKSGVRRK